MDNGEWKIDVIVNYQPPYSKVCANDLENGGLKGSPPYETDLTYTCRAGCPHPAVYPIGTIDNE